MHTLFVQNRKTKTEPENGTETDTENKPTAFK